MKEEKVIQWKIKAVTITRGPKPAAYLAILYSSKKEHSMEFLDKLVNMIPCLKTLLKSLIANEIVFLDKDKVFIKDLARFVYKALDEGCPLEEVVEMLTWKEFEELCSQVISQYSYEVLRNFRFKIHGKRHEVDIVGIKSNIILSVDCKQWFRLSGGISKAALKHWERTTRLADYFKYKGYKFNHVFPILIVYKDLSTKVLYRTFIVPFHKLKKFLEEIDVYYVTL